MPFEEGKSGNPKGRPPGAKNKNTIPKPDEINDEIQRYGLRAIKKLVKQMDDKTVSASIQQRNAQWLAEQYYKIEDMKQEIQKATPDKKTDNNKENPPKAPIVSLKAIK